MRRVPIGSEWWGANTRYSVLNVLWNAEFEYHACFYTRVYIKSAYYFELEISWQIGISCHLLFFYHLCSVYVLVGARCYATTLFLSFLRRRGRTPLAEPHN